MHFSVKVGAALAFLAAGLTAAPSAQAGAVGDIQAFYNAVNPFGVSPGQDAPTFVFENTSGADITNGIFTIGANSATVADSFDIGTLAAGGSFILTPGVQNDGQAGHTFFAATGARDTSDSGPSEDTVPFEFTGLQNGIVIDSGIFTPNATKGESPDKTIPIINFLGGGPNSDGACNNCFAPTVVATLNTPQPVPEATTRASTALLLALGMGSIYLTFRKKKA